MPKPTAGGIFNADDALERHNAEQRIRREAYAEALGGDPQWREKVAAEHYPLLKRVPKVIDDPHGIYQWMARFDPQCDTWHAACVGAAQTDAANFNPWPGGVLITPERLRALAALLDGPWTEEEDTSVEGSAT